MEVKKDRKHALVAASVAGLLALTGLVVGASAVYAEDVKCSGINGCKGEGKCAGADHSCAGKNACKGQGWINSASAEECTKAGGTVVAEEKK